MYYATVFILFTNKKTTYVTVIAAGLRETAAMSHLG
jgi:hypothetical protein